MLTLNPKYITDRKGKKISVILPIKEFQTIVEELEELEDIRLYDEAKGEDMQFTDAEQAFKEIEDERSRKNG